MKVQLKFPWFGPDGNYYDGPQMGIKGSGLHEMSQDLYDKLPSTAKIVNGVKKEVDKGETLKDYDHDRTAGVEMDKFVAKGKK